MTVPSRLPAARDAPSAANARDITAALCPTRGGASSRPLATSQSLTFRLSPAHARILPFGEKAKELTLFRYERSSDCKSFPVVVYHNRGPPIATIVPLG